MNGPAFDDSLAYVEVNARLNDDQGRNWFTRGIYRLLGWEDNRLRDLFNKLSHGLDLQEQEPVRFYEDMAPHERTYYARLKLYEAAYKKLIAKVTEVGIDRFKDLKQDLERKIVAMKYRWTRQDDKCGGLNTVTPMSTEYLTNYKTLKRLAEEWKTSQGMHKTNTLNDLEDKQLREAATYEKWVPLFVDGDKKYQHDFFRWAFDNHNPVNVFISCPATRKRIQEAVLSSSLGLNREVKADGTIGKEVLRFTKVPRVENNVQVGEEQILTIPVFKGNITEITQGTPRTQRINILDPETLVENITDIRTGVKVSEKIKNIFKESGNRNATEVEYNFGPYGIFKGNPKDFHLQAVQQANLPEDFYLEFMNQQVISKAFMSELYPNEPSIQNNKIFFRLCASYKREGSIVDTHGWLQICIPKGNNYLVYDYGKFANQYVSNGCSKLGKLGGTDPAAYIPYDQNGNMTMRKVASLPFFTNDEETKNIFGLIRAQMQKESVFQLASEENCAANAESLLRKGAPRLCEGKKFFKTSIFEGTSGYYYFDAYFKSLKDRHWVIKYVGIFFILMVFAAWRGITVDGERKSVWNYYWTELRKPERNPDNSLKLDENGRPIYNYDIPLYNSSLLAVNNIANDKLLVYYGHTERNLPALMKNNQRIVPEAVVHSPVLNKSVDINSIEVKV